MSTLKDVAAQCGLDISTVSRALRSDPRVKENTRIRVREAAEQLHYTPNLAARNLVKGQSRTLTLITSSLTNLVDREPAQFASTFLQGQGYDLMISLSGNDEAVFERLINRLDQNIFDGAILIPGCPLTAEAEKALKRLKKKGFPLVYLDRWESSVPFPVVTTDNRAAGAGLAGRLLDRGCETILILSERQNGVEVARVEGEVEACRHRGIEPFFNPETIPKGGPVGILSTTFGRINRFVQAHQGALTGRTMVFGVFDEWQGSVYPARDVVVCEQDFKAMAEAACQIILEGVEGEKQEFIKALGYSVRDFP